MRIAVLGAGAIGAYVGASLACAGGEVHLIARGPQLIGRPQLDALRERGVQVRSERGDFSAHRMRPTTRVTSAKVECVFLGLKAHSYAGVTLPCSRRWMRPSSCVGTRQIAVRLMRERRARDR